MFWLITIITLAILFWYYCIKPLKYFTEKGIVQTKPWPLLGDTWMTLFRTVSPAEFIRYLYELFPNVRYFGIYQFTLPILVIKDFDLIKQITIKDFDYFNDHRGFVDMSSDPFLSENLFNLNGQRWREMRATLSGTFTSSKMKLMFGLMTNTATNLADYFLNKNEDVTEIEMKDILTRYTNDVIASVAFGIQVDSLKEPNNRFYLMGRKLTDFTRFVTNLKFLLYSACPKLLNIFKISVFDGEASEFFAEVLNETINTRIEKGIVRPDVINMLLETRKGVNKDKNSEIDTEIETVGELTDSKIFKTAKNLSNTEIAAQAIVFFFAGFDTISTAMSFGVYELAVNRDVQEKLRQEIIETDNKCNGNITYEVLLGMKYLDMVVSEMLRKWSPAVLTDRICTKPYTIQPVQPNEKPVHIKKGQLIWIPIYSIQHNPVYYPDPDKFNPDRFSKENKNMILANSYLPFGIGPRACIGLRLALLEMKALFYKLLLNFDILPSEKMTIPIKLSRKTVGHTAADGFWVKIKRIQK